MTLHPWPLCLIFIRKDLGLRNGLEILGTTYGPIVLLKEGYTQATLKHELWHVGQAWRCLIIFHYLLKMIPAYAEWSERKATEAETM